MVFFFIFAYVNITGANDRLFLLTICKLRIIKSMKRIACLLTALIVMGTAQESVAQQRKTTTTKTVTKKPTSTQPAIKINFKGDLGRWALRGPVKRYVQGYDTIYFNRDGFQTEKNGKLLSSNAQESTTITRNSQGRIASIKNDNFDEYGTYYYNANGLMTKYYWVFRETRKMTRTYTYNSNGELTKMVWTETGGPQDGTLVRTYTILERDSYGNWTKRKMQDKYNSEIETAEISYYEDTAPSATTSSADDNRLKFLGISLGETATAMKEKLELKGFTVGLAKNEEKYSYYALKGVVYGVQSNVDFWSDKDDKITMFRCCDKKDYSLAQGRERFKKVIAKQESIYGKGSYSKMKADPVVDEYLIKTSKGNVCIRLEKTYFASQNAYIVYVQF